MYSPKEKKQIKEKQLKEKQPKKKQPKEKKPKEKKAKKISKSQNTTHKDVKPLSSISVHQVPTNSLEHSV